MNPLVLQIHNLLIKNKKSIAVAESCTAGGLSKQLTETPGSSAYFIAGIAAYSNRAKTKLLGIPAGLITKKGAVSQEVALKMAEKICQLTRADIGIGITGIAGPKGESPRKPVGTVFIAVQDNKHCLCERYQFKGNRSKVRETAVKQALLLLKRIL